MATCPRCASALFSFAYLTTTSRVFRCPSCGYIEHNETQTVAYLFKDLTSPVTTVILRY